MRVEMTFPPAQAINPGPSDSKPTSSATWRNNRSSKLADARRDGPASAAPLPPRSRFTGRPVGQQDHPRRLEPKSLQRRAQDQVGVPERQALPHERQARSPEDQLRRAGGLDRDVLSVRRADLQRTTGLKRRQLDQLIRAKRDAGVAPCA